MPVTDEMIERGNMTIESGQLRLDTDSNIYQVFENGEWRDLAAREKAEIARLRTALETAPQLEQALSEYLANPQWQPKRSHIERARNDAARMAKALANE